MSIFDDITNALSEAQPTLYEAFLGIVDGEATGDTYRVLESRTGYDRFGNPLSTSAAAGETGGCLLLSTNTKGIDRLGTEVGVGVANYSVRLPESSAVTHHDQLEITTKKTGETRVFEVVAPPQRVGSFAVFTSCDLQLIEE